MSTNYIYSILNDTLNGVVNNNKLQNEIKTSNIPNVLDFIGTDGDALNIWFLSVLSSDAQTLLLGLVNNHDGIIDPTTEAAPVNIENIDVTSNAEKALKVATSKLEGSSSLLVSHNFCDKTTWFGGSTRITGETLSTSDNSTYTSGHGYWIDMQNGKLPYEDKYVSTYKPKIYIDGVLTTTGFTTNYTSGSVTFAASQEGKTITADYSHAVTNTWKLMPDTNKIAKLLGTEVKFTDDVTMPEGVGIVFQVFMTYNGVPNTLVSQTLYKSMDDFIKCTMGGVTRVAKWGNMGNDIITLNFNYITSKDLKSSTGMYIKVQSFKIVNGVLDYTYAFTGTYSHVTANIISLQE